MSKRRKKSSKAARRKRQRADERMAGVALKKWLAVQESAVLMKQDCEAEEYRSVEDGHVRMYGTSVSFGQQSASWLANAVYKGVREANVFVLNPDQYGAYYNEADLYTTRVIAEQEWCEPIGHKSPAFAFAMALTGVGVPDDARSEKRQRNPEEWREHFDRIVAEGKHVPVPDPEKWPFEAMWISFGEGVALPSTAVESRLRPEFFHSFDPVSIGLLGQLWVLTERGPLIAEAIEFIQEIDDNGAGGVGLVWSVTYLPEDGTWKHPYDMNPWICNAIHRHLLDFRTFIVEKEWKTPRRRPDDPPPVVIERRPIPRPYYLVRLKSQTITQNFASAMPPRRKFEYQHRFQVRGHERVRVRRGNLPLPADVREELERRRYTIYTINEMSQEHARLLLERGIPVKRSSEWLAVLVSWVKSHEKGPEDGPFVPSVRLA